MTVDCLPGSSYTCLDVLFFVGVSLRGALCSLRSRRLVVQYKYDTGGSAEGRGQDRQASKKGASKQASKEPAATAMLRFGREHPLGMCGARATSSCSGCLSTPNGCPPFLLFAILEKCEPPTSYHTTVIVAFVIALHHRRHPALIERFSERRFVSVSWILPPRSLFALLVRWLLLLDSIVILHLET